MSVRRAARTTAGLDAAELKICAAVDRGFEAQFAFLKELIAVPSFPGSREEGTAQQIVKQVTAQFQGAVIDEWEPELSEVNAHPNHPIREGRAWNYDGRPNLVAVVRGDNDESRSIILNGHIDVVSPEPLGAWKRDPWKATAEGDRLYGRGSNDMKAGLSSILFAVRAFLESGFRPIGSIILQSVVEEEFGGGGTIAALQRGYTAAAALFAEPSGITNISLGSAGSRFIRVEVEGRSDAPQFFHRGVNAIDPGYRVYRAISKLNQDRQRRLKGKNPAYEKRGKGVMFGDGKVTNLVVGKFRAGDFPATVAGYAQLEGRIGFPAPEMGGDVIAEYESVIRREAKKDPWLKRHPPRVSWFNAQRDPYVLDPKEPIVRQTADAVRNVVGRAPLLFATPSASDAVFLAKRAGNVGGIPTIVYGPGGANAHGADEFVSIRETREATKVIAVLLKRWCGASNDHR